MAGDGLGPTANSRMLDDGKTAMDVQLQLAGGGFSFVTAQMRRWVDEVLGPNYRPYRTGQTWSPSINLYESPSSYCLVADLAGVEVESIELRVEKNYLVLSGDRPTPRPPHRAKCAPEKLEPRKLHLMEIDHGPFLRRLKLPESVDGDEVEARYGNGFLWVNMPKKS